MKLFVVMLTVVCAVTMTSRSVLSAGEPSAVETPPVELTGDSNLVNETERDARIRLDLAKRKRMEHDHEQASQILVGIWDEPVTAGFKREALLELALNARDAGHASRALQVYSHYLQLYPQDPSIPEVLLEQGRLYRRLGASPTTCNSNCRRTARITDPAPGTADLQPRRPRGVRCSRWIGHHTVPIPKTSGLATAPEIEPQMNPDEHR